MKVRIKEKFDQDWKFYFGNLDVMHPVKSGMAGGLTDCNEMQDGEWLKIAYFDERDLAEMEEEKWQSVTIPHDWCMEGTYFNDNGAVKHHKNHGYLRAGIGNYRKVFRVPDSWREKKVGLEFEGIFRDSTVWVNGHEISHHRSGYTGFYCDLTDVLRYGDEGENVIFVRVDARKYEGWWYEGAGIYRHVWLMVTDRVHIKRHGITITTPIVEESNAKIRIQAVVENECLYEKQCRVISQVMNGEGKLLAETESSRKVDCYQEEQWQHDICLNAPRLWSPECPYQYTAVNWVYDDECLVDVCCTKFGLRTIAFDADKGFMLNGKPYLIKGVCCHQDFAGTGVALPDSVIEYKIRLLKEMGCNAYRSAHHPASPQLLDICDREGLMVMDENRKLDSSQEGISDLKEMLMRGKNHPCIFLWGMENEEILEGTIMGTRILRTLTAVTHSIDPGRPVTASMNHGWNDGGYSQVLDVVGYNYGQRGGQDVNDHKAFPGRKFIGSESASCTVTRGIYERDDKKGYCPEYGTHIPEWSCSVEKAWADVAENPFLSGVFIWTGFDYRGEPTPFEWPNVNSHFGVMDTCGFPKDNYFYLKSQWTKEPVLHILPHWNWEGQEGKTKEIWVYSNFEEVELFLNENSLGRKKRDPYGHLEWKAGYEPGQLRAVGYREGEVCMQKVICTTGKPYALMIEADRTSLRADGCDTACIRVSIVDENGQVVPTSNNLIQFSVKGGGRILGVGNGDPSSHEHDKAEQRHAFAGKCLCIVQAGEYKEDICIKASSKNLVGVTKHLILV